MAFFMSSFGPAKQQGVTLIELITVIIVLGVVSVGISGFIRTGVDIYTDVGERDQVIGDSRFVVERINRELRSAIPNSIRVATDNIGQCIEFVPAEWVTFYTSLPVEPDFGTTATIVEFAGNTAGFSLETADFAIVYPTSNDDVYDPSSGKRQLIASCNNALNDCTQSDSTNGIADLTITSDLTIPVAFEDHSPASRLYIARNAVSYCAIIGTNAISSIYRSERALSSVNQTQLVYPASTGVLMAENLANDLSNGEAPFSITGPSLTRNGLVQVFLSFNRNDEMINFNSEVHIPNVP